jgi:hypothetical protein
MKVASTFLCAVVMLAACATKAPPRPSNYDPLGLGMNTPEYLFWLLTLEVGPPIHQ